MRAQQCGRCAKTTYDVAQEFAVGVSANVFTLSTKCRPHSISQFQIETVCYNEKVWEDM